MIYLPDTNVCINYLRSKHAGIQAEFRSMVPNEIAICDIVSAELWYGTHRGGQFAANAPILRAFLAPFPSRPFDHRSAEVYGNIRRVLEVAGTPIGPYDLQIAAVALANGLTLVTHNMREFSRVPELRLEDWEI
jgi:tRNA(fMet)-specific endonuclease VapC